MGITERIDNITAIKLGRRQEVVPAPESVKIELTGRCNYACQFCARSLKLRDQKDIDKEFFKRIIKELYAAGVMELGLFYLGESFMVSWLPEAIKLAKSAGFPYVFITTNGSLANKSKVEACMEAGLDSLKWSYNYCDEEQFVQVAGVKRKIFADVERNIRDAFEVRNKGGYGCGLYASYIEYDGKQRERMKVAIEGIRPYVDEVYALPLYNQAALVSKTLDEKKWPYIAGNSGRLDKPRDRIPCWALFTEGHISWDGKLTGCCFAHTTDFDLGDLTQDTFMDCWNSDRARWFRRHHLSGDIKPTPCRECLAWK